MQLTRLAIKDPNRRKEMFADKEAIATLGVKNLDVAKKFYEGKLGLTPQPTGQPVVSYKCGSGSIMIYESQFAGTNEATAVGWMIPGDIQQFARELAGKGVT